MTSAAKPAENARSVASAARAYARAVRENGDVEAALDWLEVRARQAIENQARGFDAAEAPSDDETLAEALAQLSIGTALCTAEYTRTPDQAGTLESAADALDTTADALDDIGAKPRRISGFDSSPAQQRTVVDAGSAALDEMSGTAANVLAAIVDKTAKPLLDRVPENLRGVLKQVAAGVPQRLMRWGLRAARRGLELLRRIVDVDLVERARTRIDDLLSRLGKGADKAVLAGWAIGADSVRDTLAEPAADLRDDLLRQLGELVTRFGKLCGLLRKIAVAITGLSAALALFQIALPHASAFSVAGLALVLGAVIVLGRDFTGATDLPSKVRGVRLLLEARRDAPA
jgi:hypothetical protein